MNYFILNRLHKLLIVSLIVCSFSIFKIAQAQTLFAQNQAGATFSGVAAGSAHLNGYLLTNRIDSGFRVDVTMKPSTSIPKDADGNYPVFKISKSTTASTIIKVAIDPNGYILVTRWINGSLKYVYSTWAAIAPQIKGTDIFTISVRFDTKAMKIFVYKGTDINSTTANTQSDYSYFGLGLSTSENLALATNPNNYLYFPNTNIVPTSGFISATLWDNTNPSTSNWTGDHGINPVSATFLQGNGISGLPDPSTITSALSTSSGNTQICIGSTTQLSNSTANGVWTSSNTAIATVDGLTGIVTGVGVGTATITYTLSYGNTKQITNSVITVNALPTAAFGNGLNFDGINDYVGIPTNASFPSGNSAYTLEARIKPSVQSKSGIIGWGNWGSKNQTNALRLGTNNTIVNYWWSNDLTVSTTNLADGSWHHVAATFDGSTRTIYVDGVLKGQDNPVGHNVLSPVTNIRIGSTNSAEYFNGSLDEVRIWSVARTHAEIQASMNTGLSGTEAGLVSYYNLNQGTAGGTNAGITSVFDNANNANSGALNNFALTGLTSNWVIDSIDVSSDSICVNNSIQLHNTTTGGIWSSSDTSVATVSSTGLVLGIAQGSATIKYTASATNSSGCTSILVSTTTIKVNGIPMLSGNKGNALDFDGVDDYVTIVNNTTTDFTIETYIKTSATSLIGTAAYNGNGLIYSDVSGVSNDFTLAVLNNKIAFFDGNKNAGIVGNTVVTDGIWHHIAVTRTSGGAMNIYIDGNLDATGAAGTGPLTANGQIILGANITDSRYFTGSMDEVRIWNYAKTQTQILSTINSELTGTEAGLISYYNFNLGIAGGTNNAIVAMTDGADNTKKGWINNFAFTGPTSNWVTGAPTFFGTVCANSSIQLSNTITGGIWLSSDATIAKVNSSTGLLTGISAGLVTISYTATNATGCSATSTGYIITVLNSPIKPIIAASSNPSNSSAAVTLISNVNNNDAINFNGNNQYVKANSGSQSVNGSFTVEAWVKPSFTSGVGAIFSTRSNGNNHFDFKLQNGNTLHGDIGDTSNNWITTSADVTLSYTNIWYHIAYVVTSNYYQIYVNGDLKAMGMFANIVTPCLFNINNDFLIGATADNYEKFIGSIDEVRIWNVARTGTEIKNYYNKTLPANNTGLIAYYKFDDGTGNSGIDLSGYSRTAMLVNGASWLQPSTTGIDNTGMSNVVYSTYNWSLSPNGISIGALPIKTVYPSATTTYYLTGTLTNGCSATSDGLTITINPIINSTPIIPLAIMQENKTISVFPNPVHDIVTLQLAKGMEDARIVIISELGTIVATDSKKGLQRNISLVGNSKGIYLVKVILNTEKPIIKKIILQ